MTKLADIHLPGSAGRFGGQHGTRSLLLAGLFPALLLISLIPVLLTTVPPLVDYPNHLARLHILAFFEDISALRQNYAIDWSVRPNLGMDILLPSLARIVGVYDAGRIFVAGTLLLLVAGTIFLRHIVLERIGLIPVLTFLVLYNHILFLGFLNYIFGVGIFLFLFSWWIHVRERINAFYIVSFSMFACGLFFVHFFAVCVYAFSVLAFEAWRAKRRAAADARPVHEIAAGLCQFVPVAALTVFWLSQAAGRGAGLGITYGSLDWKLLALFSPVVFGGMALDVVLAVSALAVVVWAWRSGKVAIADPMRWPIAGLSLIALFVPNNITGVEIWAGDARLPLVIVLLTIASVQVSVEDRTVVRAAMCGMLVLFTWRIVDVTATWNRIDGDFREFRTALHQVKPGSSILLVQDRDDMPAAGKPFRPMQYWHMASLGAIERSTLTPMQFTGHMSLRAADRRLAIDSSIGSPLSRKTLRDDRFTPNSVLVKRYAVTRHLRPYWGEWPRKFDYVLVVRFSNLENPVPEILKPLVTGSFFDIYSIDSGTGG
jgi:hypothetical protein